MLYSHVRRLNSGPKQGPLLTMHLAGPVAPDDRPPLGPSKREPSKVNWLHRHRPSGVRTNSALPFPLPNRNCTYIFAVNMLTLVRAVNNMYLLLTTMKILNINLIGRKTNFILDTNKLRIQVFVALQNLLLLF